MAVPFAFGWWESFDFKKGPYDGIPWALVALTVGWYYILKAIMPSLYISLRESYGELVAGPLLAWTFHMVFYHVHSGIYQIMDETKGWWNERKVSEFDKKGPWKITYWQMLPNVVRNQCIFLVVGIVNHKVFGGRGWNRATQPYDDVSWANFLFEFVVMYITYELQFYGFHRLLHNMKFNFWGLTKTKYNLYTKFHRLHHMTFASVGLSGLYMTGVDCFLTQTLPQVVGPTLINSHPMILWVGAFVGSFNAIHTHSCYSFWGFPAPHGHELHHSRYTVNYGTGPLDELLGTILPEKDVVREGYGLGGKLKSQIEKSKQRKAMEQQAAKRSE